MSVENKSQWYRIPCDKKTNPEGYIEYSLDFKQFVEQVTFNPNWANGYPYIFSNLDGRVLCEWGMGEPDDDQSVWEKTRQIHKKILSGGFGVGTIVD